MAIVRAFAGAAARRSPAAAGRVIVATDDPAAPSTTVAAGRVALPAPDDTAYGDALRAVVVGHGIDLVVPLGETELPTLAAAAPDGVLAGTSCRVAVSTFDFVAMAGDKWRTVEWAAGHGVAAPPTWRADALPVDRSALPELLFVRPRGGTGSRGARAVPRDLLAPEPTEIVQPLVRRPEVTVDALFDFDGRLVHAVPRLRLEVEAGRSVRAVTVHRPALAAWLDLVLAALGRSGARGLVSVQAFLTGAGPLLVEVNARAANGLPLTIAAGGDHPGWLLDLAAGAPLDPPPSGYIVGLTMQTYPDYTFGPA